MKKRTRDCINSAIRCAERVAFENDGESFIKLCYSLEDKITTAVDEEINMCDHYYIDRDMAISDVKSSIYIYLRNDNIKNGKFSSKFYYMCNVHLPRMARDAISNQISMDGISDEVDYGGIIGFHPLSFDRINEAKLLNDIITRFQDAVSGKKRSSYKIGMAKISQREMQVIALYLGFTSHGAMTYEQIGKRYNVTHTRISQIFNKGIRKLRSAVHFLAIYDNYFVGAYISENTIAKEEPTPVKNNKRKKIIIHNQTYHVRPINADYNPELFVIKRFENRSTFVLPEKYEWIENFTGNLELPDLDMFIRDTSGLELEMENNKRYLSFRGKGTQFHSYTIDKESFLKNELSEVSYTITRQVFIRSTRDDTMSIVIYINANGKFVWSFVPPYHIRFEVQKKDTEWYSTRVVAYKLSGTFVRSIMSFFDRNVEPNPYRSIIATYGNIILVSDETLTKNPPDPRGADEEWMRSMYEYMVNQVAVYQQRKRLL